LTPLRVGTRGSALALAQARWVATRLPGAKIVEITTSGDRARALGDKSRWVDTIEAALVAGEIDLAVHSAKDLPAEEDEGFMIAAVPLRADPGDVLICRNPGELAHGAVIGTSSLRRRAQLMAAFPRFDVADIRGNVGTRLQKLADREVDALVLAAAGLARLGLNPPHTRPLPLEAMVPAPGQGCLAVQTRDDDEETIGVLRTLDDPVSHRALDAERSLMWRLGGGCSLPLGAYATVDEDLIRLVAIIATPDGDRVLRVSTEGATPEDAAAEAAKSLIAQGAERILAQVEVG
jgi:hydroxymethylbilane synthase